jgi:hypothetical protein
MKGLLKQALWDASPRLFNHVTRRPKGQVFSIGIFAGRSPLRLKSPRHVVNPVLTASSVTDVPAAFVADPFMIREGGHWYLFCEVLNQATRRGEIALATSNDAFTWQYAGNVLREPFHLAYPQVVSDGGEHFMIPDSPGEGVRLYRAREFPHGWEYVATLISGGRFSDSSVFRCNGTWWMHTAWSMGNSQLKSLRFYYADNLRGPWTEHPLSPLIEAHDSFTRPAGRAIVHDGTIVRFTQDGFPKYGSRVRAFEIFELDRRAYRERELVGGQPVLQGCGSGWNADGMHHLDPHVLDDGTWIACVDGWHLMP